MASRRLIKITFPIISIIGLYFLGPSPKKPEYVRMLPNVPAEAVALEAYVQENEAKHQVKPGNEANIVWYDSTKQRTEYAIVYLHGFSASHTEGNPTHRRMAETFGCNLYLSRLADHGIDTTEALLHFTADRTWRSACEALAVGKSLGEKVILLSTSTGGTLALKLAAEFPEDVHALINLSPNIAINDPASFLLNNPWGLYIARSVLGGNYNITDANEEHARFWNKKYRIEALTELQELIETTMNDGLFKRVKQPSLTLYYYKNEEEQDPQVKVSAMLEMHKALGTPESMKVAQAVPTAGAHVIGSSLTSKDIESVYQAIEKFAVEKLNMSKVQ